MHTIELTDEERKSLLGKLEGDYKKIIMVKRCNDCPFYVDCIMTAACCMMKSGMDVYGSSPPSNCPIRPGIRIEIND